MRVCFVEEEGYIVETGEASVGFNGDGLGGGKVRWWLRYELRSRVGWVGRAVFGVCRWELNGFGFDWRDLEVRDGYGSRAQRVVG